jgi:PKD repeat protein
VGRRKPSLRRVTVALAAAGTFATSCHARTSATSSGDAATDAAVDGPAPLTLDISVTGCAVFDLTAITCNGWAPLALSFSPVGSLQLTTFLWTFGDGSSPSSARAPMHTYALPGSYDVSVTGAGVAVGSISQRRLGFVVVEPQPVGQPCDVDAQCAHGLACACKPGSGCPSAFARGICSTACATGFCGAGAACAAFALGQSGADGGADAGGSPSVCLATCQADADCATGFVCQSFRAGGAGAAGWVRGCLPMGAAADVGGSCRSASGRLDGSLCTTDNCVDVGALGLCTAACTAAPGSCPAGFGCARLPDGQFACLRACEPGQPCSSDPQLTCAAPTTTTAPASDAGGFTIIGSVDGGAYCGPS